MDETIIQLVNDKKFTEFSDVIKNEFDDKLKNHEYVKDFVTRYNDIKNMKQSFQDISNTYGKED